MRLFPARMMRLTVITLVALSAILGCCFAQEFPSIREYFYVGGRYVDDGTGSGQQIFSGQMYVERLTPSDITERRPSRPYPLVFIHGQAQSGTNWLNKPDGSSGWASYFVEQGFEVYLIDQPFRARSNYHVNEGVLSNYSSSYLQRQFTASERYNLWPQAKLHTQWPGTGVQGDPYFDAYYASTVSFISSAPAQQLAVQAAAAALLDRIGKPVILIGHSQGGIMPWVIGDVRTNLTAAIVAIEPSGPAFQNAVTDTRPGRPWGVADIPLTYSPAVSDPATELQRQTIPAQQPDQITNCTIQASSPAPRQLVNLAKIPTIVMTAEASYHAVYDWCTVEYLRQAGIQVEHLNLADVGIHGNGHLVFLEKNSDEIAGLLLHRISQIV